jgi:hypothetical protein
LEKELPLSIELNQEIKPIGGCPKIIPICLNHKISGKIFPFTFATYLKGKAVNMRKQLYYSSLENLHILKKISRERYNLTNNCHYGISTNLTHWRFNMFKTTENALDIENDSNLNMSIMYRVNYNHETKEIDWVELTEMLNFLKQIILLSENDYKYYKGISDERFKESANFKRRVLI